MTTQTKNIYEIFDIYIYNKKNRETIENDYKYSNNSVIDDVKYLIINNLTEVERRILLLYVELGNLRALSKELNCSTAKASYLVKRIKNKLRKLCYT